MPNNIRLTINKDEFKKKLGLKQPVVDYARIQREVRKFIEDTRPRDGTNGNNGTDGKDGSPDTGAEIVSKINKLGPNGPKISASQIDGLTVFIGGGGSSSATGVSLSIGSAVTSGIANTVLYLDGSSQLKTLATFGFDGSILTTPNLTVTTALKNTALTSGRVPFMTTGGQFTDSSSFTFSGGSISVTNVLSTSVNASTSVITPTLTTTSPSSGVTITGNNSTGLNANLRVTGSTHTGTGDALGVSIENIYNQSGGAATTDLRIRRTETGLGSGLQLFVDFQVATTSKFSVTKTGGVNAVGDIAFDGGSFVFNDSGADKDFRIEGDTDANLFFTDASTDRIGIGTSSPSARFHLSGADEGVNGFLITKANNASTAGDVFRIQDASSRNGVIFGVNNDAGYFKTQYVTGAAYVSSDVSSGNPVLTIARSGTGGFATLYFLTAGGSDTYFGHPGDGTTNLVLSAGSTTQTWTRAGTIGLNGVTSPTAVLHLPAGTATANTAPLKFNTGTLLTSPEAGAIEFLTDLYYGTTTTGTKRRVFAAALSGRVTAQTAAAASVATYTLGATDGTFEVSANILITTSTTYSFNVTVAYTDEGNTARTLTLSFSTLAGVISNAAISNLGGAVPYEGTPLHIRCKASTAITIATTGTFTSVTYNCEGIIKQVS